ncbi:MAG TPA: STAS domain-containing protein [Ignavibacteriaceae bacterium]|nr:STAS domain-containing protein [Ignavibacteriaceae bacterium]
MNFKAELKDKILTQSVLLTRATKKESEEFKEILLTKIKEGNTYLVIDLTLCEFIDSTFLSALISGLKEVKKQNGIIKILAKHQEVLSLLDKTGMGKVFEIERV